MNASRAMLLTAIMFVAPYSIAMDTPADAPKQNTIEVTPPANTNAPIESTEKKTEEKAGMLAKAAIPFVFVATQATKAADFAASWSVNPIMNKITDISFLNGFKAHVPTAGRVMVATAALYAAVKVYQAYQAQDVDSNDDSIFGDEDDNN